MRNRRLLLAAWVAICTLSSGAPLTADELHIGGTGIAQGIMRLLAVAYMASHPGEKVEIVSGLGSSGGLAAVAEGPLQLAAVARPLKPEERKRHLTDIPLLETPIIFVSSHPDQQQATIADVVAIHQGSLTKWPEGSELKPILRLKGDSATQFLANNIFGMRDALETLRKRPEIPVAATDQDNAELAEQISGSFTSMTLVQFLTEKPRLRIVKLDGMAPSVDAIRSDPFLLKLDLYLVQRRDAPAIVDRFLRFVKSPKSQTIISNNGALPLTFRTAIYQ